MAFNKITPFFIMSFLMLMCCLTETSAQEKFNTEVPKDIIIFRSTKDYKTALAAAKQAATRLHKKLDLRGLTPNKIIGLTMSKADCMGSGGGDDLGYPCYQARGDGSSFNDNYLSIEYSNAYKGFTKGYYMVVAALTDVKSADRKARLPHINKLYSDAYAKPYLYLVWLYTLTYHQHCC